MLRSVARRLTAPERNRRTTWKEFLTQQWDLIVVADFSRSRSGRPKDCTVRGAVFIDLPTRRVAIGGISSAAKDLCVSQIAPILTDSVDGPSRASAT